MPSPKTAKCIELLYILCHCRIPVYAQTNAIPLTRTDQTFSRSNKFLKFFRNIYTSLASAVNKQAEKMLTGLPQKQNKWYCKPVLKNNTNTSVSFYSPQKSSGQLQGKFKSPIDKVIQRAISIVRRLPASKKIVQPNSTLRLLLGTPVNFSIRHRLKGLKISEQEELLTSQRIGLLMTRKSSTEATRVIA
ncbi:hypothetical protein QTN47_20120 [Danxiaibacter flavus]|uniref:Uncharacterized protein n=1 Tax=Danxiaibacter flavus TaxID=3049108 RepID=A0ABV3ZMX7_9BACT|nr:hypothetical protein QNM32_20130 [Chitinophagaceae bacterium DXS]